METQNKLTLQEHSRGLTLVLNNVVLASATHYGKKKIENIYNILRKSFFISGLTVQCVKQYKTPKKELNKKRVYNTAAKSEAKYYEDFKKRQQDHKSKKEEEI